MNEQDHANLLADIYTLQSDVDMLKSNAITQINGGGNIYTSDTLISPVVGKSIEISDNINPTIYNLEQRIEELEKTNELLISFIKTKIQL